jgi:methyl-accepting chemotaxis protein
MEELEATQEEMRRKSETMERLLTEAREKEQIMQAQEKMMQESIAQLRESQEIIKRTTLELNGQAMAIDTALATVEFNLDSTIIKANDNFLRLMGYEHFQVQGKRHCELVPEVYAASMEYKQFWEDLREGKTLTGDFYRLTKAGKTVWLKASYTPVRDETGKVYKVIKFAHDITRKSSSKPKPAGACSSWNR